MKKTLLIIALLLICWDIKAQNNQQINATINVSAQFIQSIQLITVKSISFGSVDPGQAEVNINPNTDPNAGFMIAVGTPGAQFRLEYLPQRALYNTSGGTNLAFTYQISGNTIEDQASSEIIQFNDRNLTFNAEGFYYVWVGGIVNIENAEPGNYEGDFTIEIDYI